MAPETLLSVFILINTCVALGAAFFILWWLKWLVSDLLDVPFVPTPTQAYDAIIDALDISPGDIVYELGSGDGRFLLWCAKKKPGARYVGIEANPILHLWARTLWRLAGSPAHVSFRRGDFFKADLSEATKIYVFLLTKVMAALHPKFERELSNARIVSRAFRIPGRTEIETIVLSQQVGRYGQGRAYVYEFKK